MKNNNAQKMISAVTWLVAFALPLFFLPITTEFYEFNKLALLTGTVMILVALWAVTIATRKKVNGVRSPLNLPILLTLIIVVLSSIFSIDKTASLYGSYGRWFPSMLGIITIIGLYYAIAINLDTTQVKKVIAAIIYGSTLSTIVAVLSYMEIYLGETSFLRSPNFSTTGSTTTNSALAAIMVVMGIVTILNSKSIVEKTSLTAIIIINFLAVVAFGGVGWIVVGIGTLSALAFAPQGSIKTQRVYLISALIVMATTFTIFNIPQTSALVVNNNLRQELKLPFNSSWKVASTALRDFPLIGAGSSTFGINFTRYRPLSLNSTTLWNTRFDKPHSEIFNIIESMGLIGILVSTFFVATVLKLVTLAKKLSPTQETQIICVGIISILTLFTVTYATVLTTTLFFILLALLTVDLANNSKIESVYQTTLSLSSFSTLPVMGLLDNISERKSKRNELFHYFAITALLGFIAVEGYYMFYKAYAAEYYMRKSITAMAQNKGAIAYEIQQKAINRLPIRAQYHSTYAQTNLALANSLTKKPNLTDDEIATVQNLIAQAIREIKVATETLSPLDARGWETRAGIYNSLTGVAQDAGQWALGATNTAIQLDPSNPRLRINAGGIYYAMEAYLPAANAFRQAANLKPDYANAHYNLAQTLIKLQDYEAAQRELEITQRLLPQNAQDQKIIMEELGKIKELIPEDNAEKPSVVDLENQLIGDEAPTNQEPLTTPGDTN